MRKSQGQLVGKNVRIQSTAQLTIEITLVKRHLTCQLKIEELFSEIGCYRYSACKWCQIILTVNSHKALPVWDNKDTPQFNFFHFCAVFGNNLKVISWKSWFRHYIIIIFLWLMIELEWMNNNPFTEYFLSQLKNRMN